MEKSFFKNGNIFRLKWNCISFNLNRSSYRKHLFMS